MESRADQKVQKLLIGQEKAPLVIIDNFAKEPLELVELAAAKLFVKKGHFFPGVRARAPLSYRSFLLEQLEHSIYEFFGVENTSRRLSMCHFSLVTTPAQNLAMEQRIPHIDSVSAKGLATVHYLFKEEYGGTAFYRHRKTGFEFVDKSRQDVYLKCLQEEMEGSSCPGPEYINGDTPLFEQIAAEEGAFNRILIYRRNSLHSGCIDSAFVPDPDPRSGRLSINSFIDPGP